MSGLSTPATTPIGSLLQRLVRLYSPTVPLAILAGVTLYLFVRSAGWPLIHDAPLMHYIAARILAGDVPYRDIVDMNLPGTYLLHMLVLSMLGGSDAAWRAVDGGFVLLGGAAIARYCWPSNQRIALWAAMGFVLYHLSEGAVSMGQRDFVIVPLLVLALDSFARSLETAPSRRGYAAVGLLIGVAATIKPYVMLLLGALMLVHLVRHRRQPRVALGAAALAAWSALPLALTAAWLAAIGALEPFLDSLFGYLLPYYGRLMRESLLALLIKAVLFVFIFTGLCVGLPMSLRWATLRQPRMWLAGIAVLYGMAHFIIQGKGWIYHLYPLLVFSIIFVALGCAAALRQGPRQRRLGLIAVLVAGICSSVAAYESVAADISLATAKPLVEPLVRDLQELRLGPNDTVQVLDTTEGGIHALLRLGISQPTPFIYDFQFLHDRDAPLIQAMRARFIDGLRARPPRAIVVFHTAWLPPHTLARFDSFPEFTDLLSNHYTISKVRHGREDNSGYTLYLPKGDR